MQYFEMLGCRALYQDGWKAVMYHPIQVEEPGLDVAAWELYDVRVDPSEMPRPRGRSSPSGCRR